MTPRAVLGLALVTLIATCGALYVTLQQPAAGPARVGDDPAFPALRALPDAVAKVIITTPAGALTLTRSDDRWVAPDRHDYPVAADKLRELIFQLADMRLIEAKTSRPERYARLEVEDVTDGAGSRRVRVEDADGAVLAEAIFGKRRERLTGSEHSGTYLRRPGEAQSWLASGGIKVDEKVQDWLDQDIVALPGDSVQRVEIHPPSGQGYSVVRDAPKAELRLDGLAEGETLKKDANLNQLLGTLATVRLEDVQPVREVDWPDQEHTVRVLTFDGIEVTLHLASIGNQHWARVEAAPAAEGKADEGKADEGKADEDRAQEIQARTQGWAYQVSNFLFERLTKPREDWLADASTS
jgi:Domain of unknown function (DUF4340)